MTSINDVAKLAGVSIATVSRYINTPDRVRDITSAKVKKAIAATGYSPNALAQNFRRGTTREVVVVVPSIGIPFFESVMEGIWRVAKTHNYHIVIRETHHNTVEFDAFTRMLLSKQADGIILLASLSPFRETPIDQSNQKQPPIILSLENAAPELRDFPSVRIDNITAAKDATNHLIGLGHRKIAFMYGRPHENSTLTESRELGFRQAMADAHLAVEPLWVRDGGMSIDGARMVARDLLALDQLPTAIFCANDEMALGAIHEFKSAGWAVPDDISVVGFDDIRFAEVADPPLTTIAQPAQAIGERTMQRLCEAMEGEDIGCCAEIVPHQLVIRNSTAPPKAKDDKA